jgi:molybdopterin converting factor small subunit
VAQKKFNRRSVALTRRPLSRGGNGCVRLFVQLFRFKSMSITIHFPTELRAYRKGPSELLLSAPTVRAALEQIERSHPALYRCVCDETGAVRRHVNVFVNTAHVRDRDGLDTALVSGDVITILPAISGG